MNQDVSAIERRVERVLLLFRNLGALDTTIDFEQSFKAIHGHLFEDRLLLGINLRKLADSRDEQITLIGENIGMPHNLLASFKQNLPRANHVYFGLEKDENTLLFKAYLEFRDEIERGMKGADLFGRSFPLFIGFKWDTFSPTRQAITHYAWHPLLPVPEILQHLAATLDPSRHSSLLETVGRIMRRASEGIPHSDIQYLEVTEEGNPRRSFDINIYKSGLRFEDLCPNILNDLRHYAIPSGRLESLYHRIKSERVGHLAGGADREKKDFMTVYYGVRNIHSDQLGSATIVPRGGQHDRGQRDSLTSNRQH